MTAEEEHKQGIKSQIQKNKSQIPMTKITNKEEAFYSFPSEVSGLGTR
jgi:hypothetical protein